MCPIITAPDPSPWRVPPGTSLEVGLCARCVLLWAGLERTRQASPSFSVWVFFCLLEGFSQSSCFLKAEISFKMSLSKCLPSGHMQRAAAKAMVHQGHVLPADCGQQVETPINPGKKKKLMGIGPQKLAQLCLANDYPARC